MNRLDYSLEPDAPLLSALAEGLLRAMMNERGAGLGFVQFLDPVTGHRHKITMRSHAPIATDIQVEFKTLKPGESFDA